MLSLYYHELMRKIEERKQKKYFMVDNYLLNKVLGRIKMTIGIEKFDDTKISNETDDKLPDDVTLKNVAILIACVIKDDNKFYPQVF